MPQNAPPKKIDGTRNLGAEIIFCGERHEDGEIIVKELVEKEGYCCFSGISCRTPKCAGRGSHPHYWQKCGF
jgi:threonine dehydratase